MELWINQISKRVLDINIFYLGIWWFVGIIYGMDRKSKILIISFVVLIVISIFLTYKRVFLDKNFMVVGEEVFIEEIQ